jgi:hypothetical protein
VEGSFECGNEPSFHKMLGRSQMAAQLVASQVLMLSSIELVSYGHVEEDEIGWAWGRSRMHGLVEKLKAKEK